VSVAPDATVYVRLDSKDEMRIDRSDASRARVQNHGRPISAREFAALRRKPTGVTAARRSAASNGVKGWRGEPWLNQKLRPSLRPRKLSTRRCLSSTADERRPESTRIASPARA